MSLDGGTHPKKLKGWEMYKEFQTDSQDWHSSSNGLERMLDTLHRLQNARRRMMPTKKTWNWSILTPLDNWRISEGFSMYRNLERFPPCIQLFVILQQSERDDRENQKTDVGLHLLESYEAHSHNILISQHGNVEASHNPQNGNALPTHRWAADNWGEKGDICLTRKESCPSFGRILI